MSTNRRRRRRKQGVRWIQHYNSGQKILLVGEGDFSFSACLATAFGSGRNMVATCLHSKDVLTEKHWSSEAHLEKLERLGCRVLQEVDVYEMSHHPVLKHREFDVVVFNFPHAGHVYGYSEKDEVIIEMHKELLRGFFKNVKEMVKKGGGEVHVTHRDDYPYNRWKLEKLGAESGFYLKEKARFEKKDYPGYHNKRGGDINCNKTFPLKFDCFTFKFSLHLESTNVHQLKKNHCELVLEGECELERERHYERELVRKRERELEFKLELVLELELEHERERNRELVRKRERELEFKLGLELEHERERNRELVRKRERELEFELELEHEREHNRELEHEREREQERERHREREQERERELLRKREREHEFKHERECNREHEREREQERHCERELEREHKQEHERELVSKHERECERERINKRGGGEMGLGGITASEGLQAFLFYFIIISILYYYFI